MNRVVDILCRRDKISVKQALEQVRDVQNKIFHHNMDYDEAETVLMEDLGLEMDYFEDILEA